MPSALHDDELPIDLPLVRSLVDATMPEFAALALHPLGFAGSSNALFRLGEELLVRLPRQPGGATTIEKEARWLPVVAAGLPVRVPEIVAVGEPGLGYPERWSVVRWIPGDTPSTIGASAPTDITRRRLAADLAALVDAFRTIDVPEDALADPALRWYRGDPLAEMDDDTRHALEACRAIPGLVLDVDAALRLWDESMSLPGVEDVAAARWYHGDLLAENLLVRDGRLAAVLDFGGLAVGDPTIDLVVAWEVLDAGARRDLRDALGVDDATWLRGRAWALAIAVMTFPYYWRTMPARCASRLDMARAVLDDASTQALDPGSGPHV